MGQGDQFTTQLYAPQFPLQSQREHYEIWAVLGHQGQGILRRSRLSDDLQINLRRKNRSQSPSDGGVIFDENDGALLLGGAHQQSLGTHA